MMVDLKHKSPPSSGTAGFFQHPPALQSSFEEDEALKRVYQFYLPISTREDISSDLTRFSKLVLTPKIRNWCADAEKNTPYVRHYDSWGRRIDELVTTEGWRKLQDLGIQEGIVAIGHEPRHSQYARVYQFVKYHIWTPWNACVTCPSAMTDGAARLLHLTLKRGEASGEDRRVLQAAHDRLVSRGEDAWTSGQWMTERPGGSDVQNTETQATLSTQAQPGKDTIGNPLGPYSISGFKWFSSATDANTTVLLAKETSGAISAFFGPTRRQSPNPTSSEDSELNGIQIQRLKSKLGTRALPTAELILADMRAYRLGKPGQGVKEISIILNITRLHNAVTAVGYLGRGLAISRAFSKVRTARGSLLMNIPAHVSALASLHVEYRAMMHLAFYTAALLGLSEHQSSSSSSPKSPAELSPLLPQTSLLHLLRLLTPLSKSLTARAAIAGLAESMESLGGVGYLENEDITLNIARIFRDANVLSIWEGTTNIQADDLIRILKGRNGDATLHGVRGIVVGCCERWDRNEGFETSARVVRCVWEKVERDVTGKGKQELSLDGRTLLEDFGFLVCAVLLGEDALSDGDEVTKEIFLRWIARRGEGEGGEGRTWRERVEWDRRIVFGDREALREVARL